MLKTWHRYTRNVAGLFCCYGSKQTQTQTN